MMTWRTGQKLVRAARAETRIPMSDFLERIRKNPPIRIPGTAVLMSTSASGVPSTLLHHLKHNRVLHERVFIVSVHVADTPRVSGEDRLELISLGEGLNRLILNFGFTEKPDVPSGIEAARRLVPDLDPDSLTYYLGRQSVVPKGKRPGMAVWREALFAMLNRNADISADYFCIPAAQAVEIGTQIEI